MKGSMTRIYAPIVSRRRLWIQCAIAPLLALFIIGSVFAGSNDKSHFKNLQQRLIADGFDSARVQQLYTNDQVSFETRGVFSYFQHNEATLDYKKMTRWPWIMEARDYMHLHAKTLREAEEIYGVNPRIITAIILVETKFGRYLGKQSIVNILSTMAALSENEPREFLWNQLPQERRYSREQYDKKADQKAGWAYKELKAFLTYTEQHQIDPVSVVGSYAGAVGIAQFMPSNIITFGKDGNGDGRINLFEDADAIHSIANYLKYYGWKPGLDREKAYKAVFNYNRSSYYVDTILEIADLLKE